MKLPQLFARIRTDSSNILSDKPYTPQQIEEKEKQLETRFPKSLSEFLCQFGYAEIDAMSFFLPDPNALSSYYDDSGIPGNYFPFAQSITGWMYLIKKQQDPAESPIFRIDTESSDKAISQSHENFTDFLLKSCYNEEKDDEPQIESLYIASPVSLLTSSNKLPIYLERTNHQLDGLAEVLRKAKLNIFQIELDGDWIKREISPDGSRSITVQGGWNPGRKLWPTYLRSQANYDEIGVYSKDSDVRSAFQGLNDYLDILVEIETPFLLYASGERNRNPDYWRTLGKLELQGKTYEIIAGKPLIIGDLGVEWLS